LMGVYFGWLKILLAIFLAYIIGAIISLFLVVLRKKRFSSTITLGPFLVLGSLLTMFFGQRILDAYLVSF